MSILVVMKTPGPGGAGTKRKGARSHEGSFVSLLHPLKTNWPDSRAGYLTYVVHPVLDIIILFGVCSVERWSGECGLEACELAWEAKARGWIFKLKGVPEGFFMRVNCV